MKASEFALRLLDAGVVHDLNTVTRIVVDAVAGQNVKVYVTHVGDERLLDVDWGGLASVPEVEAVPDPLAGIEMDV